MSRLLLFKKNINQNYAVEGDLRKEITLNIKRLQEIGSYRGLRHKGLYLLGDNEQKQTLERARGLEKLVVPLR